MLWMCKTMLCHVMSKHICRVSESGQVLYTVLCTTPIHRQFHIMKFRQFHVMKFILNDAIYHTVWYPHLSFCCIWSGYDVTMKMHSSFHIIAWMSTVEYTVSYSIQYITYDTHTEYSPVHCTVLCTVQSYCRRLSKTYKDSLLYGKVLYCSTALYCTASWMHIYDCHESWAMNHGPKILRNFMPGNSSPHKNLTYSTVCVSTSHKSCIILSRSHHSLASCTSTYSTVGIE